MVKCKLQLVNINNYVTNINMVDLGGIHMRMSNMVIGTLRDVPAESTRDLESLKLLMKGGILRKSGSGKFNFLPIGNRVLDNIESMCINMIGSKDSQEVVLSKCDFSEIIVTLKLDIKNYKHIPKEFYCYCNREIENIKPKLGVIKAKNYRIIKIFKLNKDEMTGYEEYEGTKKAVLDKLKIFNIDGEYIEVLGTEDGRCEKLVIHSEFGDNSMFRCKNCGYNKHETIARCKSIEKKENFKELQKIHTPNIRSVDELIKFLKVKKDKIVKTLIYRVDDKIIAVLIRGDRDANEAKIRKYLSYPKILELGDEKTVLKATGASIGFAGPIGIHVDRVLVDDEIKLMNNFVVGGNETDYHYINVNFEREFMGEVGDFKNITDGDLCSICGLELSEEKVLELGILYEGLKSPEFVYDTENDICQEIYVNSYSVGTSRLLGIISEKNRDDRGIIWPRNVAPFDVAIIIAVVKNDKQLAKAEEMYTKLTAKGLRVILDDRDERAGVKFKDCELLGIPFRIILGKKIDEGLIEFKKRSENDSNVMTIDECLDELIKIYKL